MSIDKTQRDAWAKLAELRLTHDDEAGECECGQCRLYRAVPALLAELARVEQERDQLEQDRVLVGKRTYTDLMDLKEQHRQTLQAAEATAAKWQRVVEGMQNVIQNSFHTNGGEPMPDGCTRFCSRCEGLRHMRNELARLRASEGL